MKMKKKFSIVMLSALVITSGINVMPGQVFGSGIAVAASENGQSNE